jgi:hypothetical protein
MKEIGSIASTSSAQVAPVICPACQSCDSHEGQEPGRRQLLAVHDMRRNMECITHGG